MDRREAEGLEPLEAQLAELDRQVAARRAEIARLRAGIEDVRGVDVGPRTRGGFARGVVLGVLLGGLLFAACVLYVVDTIKRGGL